MGETEIEISQVDRERELMRAFYGCSPGAFEELSERWLPRLHAFFRARGFGREDAEDLSLDVMVRLYATKERRSFDTNRPLQPFLFTIADRLAIAEWRRRGDEEEKRLPLSAAINVCSQETDTSSELLAELMNCVRELSEPEQYYVSLCERHGLGELSHNDIATVLGKWPAQVTQISKRARGALKACLTKKGY